ncbi:MAG: 4-alpha-glucanotransferase [Deltaproteobacteria bacterium]|nr:MAG: 4-alpha-glucanotransferase [Deltaproteobacteria bacterium]
MIDTYKSSPLSQQRGAGILLHLTSLPSPWGIGDLGPEAEKFLDFLRESGQSYWQFLPLGPTCAIHGHSPYMSTSAFAGNPLLISPDLLLRDGWVSPEDISDKPDFYQYLVRFDEVATYKENLFEKAFIRFQESPVKPEAFTRFCTDNLWLDNYTLYVTLSEKFTGKPWYEWPDKIARRDVEALKIEARELKDRISYHKFIQFLLAEQWCEFREKAQARNIKLIGDVPIYVALDSADVWTHQDCFQIDPKTLKPDFVAGVPPDYFSETGQIWGNPLYRWDSPEQPNRAVITWWQRRMQRLSELVDVVRIDHFRGFEAYWQIPAGAATAAAGEWVKGPGAALFNNLQETLESLPIIAEDLGTITLEVEKLKDDFGFAGMKVLQFAFDGNPDNPYLPWNFTSENAVVYSGTHDNETTLGWYLDENVSENAKEQARQTTNSDGTVIHLDFIKTAYATIAALAIIPMQDVLGFGSDCRMNHPGSIERNWAWRCAPRFITEEIIFMLNDMTAFYNRRPRSATEIG